MASFDAFLNLLKPPGMTSHDAVAKVRRILGTRSVGHAGTLDPAAAGVLPMAVGKATRLLEYVVGTSKAYVGEATFGVQTDTLDQEGQIELETTAEFSQADLEEAIVSMIGSQLQAPPAFSAVKVRGKALHEYARQGEFIELPGRPIVVSQFELISLSRASRPNCLFQLECSKGTYVRVLVKDLASRLGTVATLTFLLRTRVGGFAICDAVSLEELAEAKENSRLEECLLPIDSAITHLPSVHLDATASEQFVTGRKVVALAPAADAVRVYQNGRLLGIGESNGQALTPKKVLSSREEIAK